MPRALIRSPSALKGVVEGNHHRSCRHKSCDQQPEETAGHFAAAPAVPVENPMVVREGRRLREADHAQHRRDGAPSWRKECARDEHQHMAEGRSREAGSERFQPGAHQLGPRLDGHGVISNNRHPVAWEVVMAARDREGILTRYRRLREISTRLHSEALRFVPRSVLLEQARRLGLTAGKMLGADSMDELTLAFDLCLYTAAPGRSRGIDRYARSAGVAPGSDEERMLQAMGQARFSVFRVERPHETAVLLVRDLMREEGLWLVDEKLERTAPMGLMLAMRVSRPETFAMTCGVMVPTNAVLIDEVLEEVQGRVRGEPAAIANDRRFATAIYRIAGMSGIMDQIGFASPG